MESEEQQAYDDRKLSLLSKIRSLNSNDEMFLTSTEDYIEHVERGIEKIDNYIKNNQKPSVAQVFKYLAFLEDYYVMIEKQSRL